MMKHKPVKTEFRWTGDGFGGASARLFKQLKRVGDMVLYERTVERTGLKDGFDVIKITRHNGYSLGGQRIEPAESNAFKKTDCHCVTLQRAEEVFNDKVKEIETLKVLEASGNAPKRRGRPRKVVA